MGKVREQRDQMAIIRHKMCLLYEQKLYERLGQYIITTYRMRDFLSMVTDGCVTKTDVR